MTKLVRIQIKTIKIKIENLLNFTQVTECLKWFGTKMIHIMIYIHAFLLTIFEAQNTVKYDEI